MSEIEKLSVFDPRIVQQRPKFAVDKGALSNTNAPFNAIAATSSQMTFNIQVPSLNVFMDRELEWTTGVNMSMAVAVDTNSITPPIGPAGTGTTIPVVAFGKDVALAAFPLQSMCSTMTATINDTVATINTSDVLYEVLRLVDRKHNKLRKNTPSMLDKYQLYNNAVGAINNPLASYYDATDYDNIPNGAFWDVVFTDATGTQLTGSGVYNDGVKNVAYTNGVPVLTSDGANLYTSYNIYFRFRATELLVLSPFIFNEECGDSVGLFGVQNVQLVFNFQSAARLIRNASQASGVNTRTVSAVQFNGSAPFVNPRVNVMFLTPSLDIALPPKSVVPYLEYPRYISTPNQQILAGQSATLQSQTITLPQIPDMLVIYAKPQVYANNGVADFYLPIDQISVNFDNFAGLLSSHTAEQLYAMSVDNGLHMDWNTWNGAGKVVNNNPSAALSVADANNVALVGGFLVLKMGKDITLQAGQAPSVVGNYTLQFNCRVNNRTADPITPALYVIAVNSGFFETQQGSSRIVKGVLTEQEVISAPPAPYGSRADLERMVGGGFMSKLGTALNKAKGLLMNPAVREGAKALARASGNKYLSSAADLADAVGLGVSGGMRTGGRARKADLKALM